MLVGKAGHETVKEITKEGNFRWCLSPAKQLPGLGPRWVALAGGVTEAPLCAEA